MCKRFFRIAAILLLLSLLLFMTGCGRKQSVSVGYDFSIFPKKKGEGLKNVTVYLPFPTKNGKPIMEIYRGIEKHYREYHLDDPPNAVISIADTKYGPMLKVQVPELKHGMGAGGGYNFDQPHSNEPVAPRFPLSPRLNCLKLPNSETGHLCESYIYVDFDSASYNAKELGLIVNYKITIFSPSLLPLDYVPQDNYGAFLGWEQPPETELLAKYYGSAGWIKVPLLDWGFDKE